MQVYSVKTLALFYRAVHSFGSYYQTVKMFSQVQETAGNKDKLAKIRQFKNSLNQEDRKQFFNLLQWYSKHESVRISSKIINKYYLNHYVPTSQYTHVEAEIIKDGVMRKLCKNDRQSELTLLDINLFLRYLCAVEGKGSQTDKAKKIIEFGENVSVLEGSFFLKLIQKRLTIGASNKTFRKMDSEDSIIEQKPKKEKKSRKPKNEQISQLQQQPEFSAQTASDPPTMKGLRQKAGQK